jgi:hypothetical protein
MTGGAKAASVEHDVFIAKSTASAQAQNKRRHIGNRVFATVGPILVTIVHLIKIASRSACTIFVRPRLSMRNSCVLPVCSKVAPE